MTCPTCTLPVSIKPTWSVITGAALADSINPCAIAVLLILLAALLAVGERRRALWSGLSFVSALYITYFVLGIGFLGVLNLTRLATLFHRIVGVLAIVIGALNIKDFFVYGAFGFVTEIPCSWRPRLKKLLHSVTTPYSAFMIGVVATLFELPCTGGPYAFVLALLAQGVSWSHAAIILLYYNVIFVLPLIILTFVLYWGLTTAERLTSWKDSNLRLLHLITGIIMLVLGVWVFWN